MFDFNYVFGSEPYILNMAALKDHCQCFLNFLF